MLAERSFSSRARFSRAAWAAVGGGGALPPANVASIIRVRAASPPVRFAASAAAISHPRSPSLMSWPAAAPARSSASVAP